MVFIQVQTRRPKVPREAEVVAAVEAEGQELMAQAVEGEAEAAAAEEAEAQKLMAQAVEEEAKAAAAEEAEAEAPKLLAQAMEEERAEEAKAGARQRRLQDRHTSRKPANPHQQKVNRQLRACPRSPRCCQVPQ